MAIVVQGERQHREVAISYREWIIEEKKRLVEEQRKQEAERQRLERERLERVEKATLDRLLAQAHALKQAEEIRAYVDAVRRAVSATNSLQEPDAGLEQWTTWALAQADRIDPIRNGRYRTIEDNRVD